MGAAVYIANLEQITYYTNEEIRRQLETQYNVAEAIAAAAAGIFAIVLADRLVDIAEDALDKEYEIRDRIFAIQQIYTDHWMNVTVPQITSAVGTLNGLSGPGPDYGGAFSRISSQGNAVSSGASSAISSLNSKNRAACGQRSCTNEAAMYGVVAIAHASHYVFRHHDRRRYEMDADYRRMAASAAPALQVKPDQVFPLMANAASLYGSIGQAALTQASNAASMAGGFFGYAAGSL